MHHRGQAPVVRFLRVKQRTSRNAPPVPDPTALTPTRFYWIMTEHHERGGAFVQTRCQGAPGVQGVCMSEKPRAERVGAGWGRFAAVRDDPSMMKLIAWAEHPLTQRYINRHITADEDQDWLAWAGERYFPEPASLGLSIGCGSGNVERRIIELGNARAMEGTDISEQALEVARAAAGDLPITYSLMDPVSYTHLRAHETRHDLV